MSAQPATTDTHLHAVLDALTAGGRAPRRSGDGWVAICPAHDDRNPSLSVSVGARNDVILYCHAGCETVSVLDALGMNFIDLRDPDSRTPSSRPRPGTPAKKKTVHVYTDENGQPLYRVQRQNLPAGKKIWQERAVAGGWTKSVNGVRQVPYRLPELLAGVRAGATVWIVEGEKCADLLAEAGLIVTTNSGGAGKWKPEFNDLLEDADVVILPDNDEPGRKHARQIRDGLDPVAANVRVLPLPGLEPGEDVYDWLTTHGHTVDDLKAALAEPEGRVRVVPPDEPLFPWPTPDEKCFYGIAGQYVRDIEKISEADPIAVLFSLLAGFAAQLGTSPHVLVGHTKHPAQLFTLIVGDTAKARKGTSWADARLLLDHTDPVFTESHVASGLSTGEGLIHRLRDPREGDTGALVDKRMLVIEPEFAKVLRSNNREGNTLSVVLREAWDGGRLEVMTKGDPMVATGYHLGVIGHITIDELRRELSETQAANGFANRHLIVAARRTRMISRPERLDDDTLNWYAHKTRTAVNHGKHVHQVSLTPEAWDLWDQIYPATESVDHYGLAGHLLARGSAHILRLAMVTALINEETQITPEHLETADALWKYAEGTVLHVYGHSLGDKYADTLLQAAREAGSKGLTGRQAYEALGRNVDKDRLHNARQTLVKRGLAQLLEVMKPGVGRPTQILIAAGYELE